MALFAPLVWCLFSDDFGDRAALGASLLQLIPVLLVALVFETGVFRLSEPNPGLISGAVTVAAIGCVGAAAAILAGLWVEAADALLSVALTSAGLMLLWLPIALWLAAADRRSASSAVAAAPSTLQVSECESQSRQHQATDH